MTKQIRKPEDLKDLSTEEIDRELTRRLVDDLDPLDIGGVEIRLVYNTEPNVIALGIKIFTKQSQRAAPTIDPAITNQSSKILTTLGIKCLPPRPQQQRAHQNTARVRGANGIRESIGMSAAGKKTTKQKK